MPDIQSRLTAVGARIRLPFVVRTNVLMAVLVVLFLCFGWAAYHDSRGDDLASSYVACRLLADGRSDVLYAHDAVRFHIVRDSAWDAVAVRAGFRGFLHPYVQIPLWAEALQPACTRLSFRAFNHLFLAVTLVAVAGLVFVSIRCLAPTPRCIELCAALLLWLSAAVPFRHSMQLTQIHPLCLLAAVVALIAAERDRPMLAGVLLAVATAVKLTPLWLVIYLAITRRWRAIAFFATTAAAIAIASITIVGWETNLAYVNELGRVSNVLLVSANNQSFAATIMASYYPRFQLIDWKILPLPAWIKAISALLSCGLVTLAGYLRRAGAEEGACVSVALVAMTVFAPIAWSHYYVVLIVPLAWLTHVATSREGLWPLLAAGVAGALCLPMAYTSFWFPLRAEFLAGILVLLACLFFSAKPLIVCRSRVARAISPTCA